MNNPINTGENIVNNDINFYIYNDSLKNKSKDNISDEYPIDTDNQNQNIEKESDDYMLNNSNFNYMQIKINNSTTKKKYESDDEEEEINRDTVRQSPDPENNQ
jgi:hypothetical protein